MWTKSLIIDIPFGIFAITVEKSINNILQPIFYVVQDTPFNMKFACPPLESHTKNARNMRKFIVLGKYIKYDVNKLFYINIMFFCIITITMYICH